jgi:hypothetical protein
MWYRHTPHTVHHTHRCRPVRVRYVSRTGPPGPGRRRRPSLTALQPPPRVGRHHGPPPTRFGRVRPRGATPTWAVGWPTRVACRHQHQASPGPPTGHWPGRHKAPPSLRFPPFRFCAVLATLALRVGSKLGTGLTRQEARSWSLRLGRRELSRRPRGRPSNCRSRRDPAPC